MMDIVALLPELMRIPHDGWYNPPRIRQPIFCISFGTGIRAFG